MRNFLTRLELVLGVGILFIPVLIMAVGNTSWPSMAKRLIIAVMVIAATVFAIAGILKPATNMIAGSIANVIFLIYLASVYIAAYKKWSH